MRSDQIRYINVAIDLGFLYIWPSIIFYSSFLYLFGLIIYPLAHIYDGRLIMNRVLEKMHLYGWDP